MKPNSRKTKISRIWKRRIFFTTLIVLVTIGICCVLEVLLEPNGSAQRLKMANQVLTAIQNDDPELLREVTEFSEPTAEQEKFISQIRAQFGTPGIAGEAEQPSALFSGDEVAYLRLTSNFYYNSSFGVFIIGENGRKGSINICYDENNPKVSATGVRVDSFPMQNPPDKPDENGD